MEGRCKRKHHQCIYYRSFHGFGLAVLQQERVFYISDGNLLKATFITPSSNYKMTVPQRANPHPTAVNQCQRLSCNGSGIRKAAEPLQLFSFSHERACRRHIVECVRGGSGQLTNLAWQNS